MAQELIAWMPANLEEQLPKRPVTQTDPAAEKILQERDWGTWVDSLRYP